MSCTKRGNDRRPRPIIVHFSNYYSMVEINCPEIGENYAELT